MHDRAGAHLSTRARVILVAGLAALLLPAALLAPLWAGGGGARVGVVALAAGQVGALWWVDRYPERVVAVTTVAGAGIMLLTPEVGPGVALVALCTLAWLRPPRVSLWGLAGLGAVAPLRLLSGSRLAVAIALVAAVLAWSWGELGRLRQARRIAEERRAVGEERARIARELHDVLAHTVSVMVVQASAADDVFESDPARAREALRAVEAAGRQAMGELRQLLHAVRSTSEAVDSKPQPGLADLDSLVRTVRAAGLEVVLRVDQAQPDVPAGVGLSAYRIVQESLTNALRHARARTAQVDVHRSGNCLVVQVVDDGAGPVVRSAVGRGAGWERFGGQGIAGMRERAAAVGGTMQVGPGSHGGFRVCAQLPLEVPR